MKLLANIFSKQVIILIDSGSSSSFFSEQLACSSPDWVSLKHLVQVRVENGQVITCYHEL
jgi:hypothetical protein